MSPPPPAVRYDAPVTFEDRAPLVELEQRLGYTFRQQQLLTRALRHGSSDAADQRGSYERLEFLGDAVLSHALATLLFERFPEADQGRLTKMRAHLARSATLAGKGAQLGLDGWVEVGRSEASRHGRERSALLEDVYEALLGAIAIDGGPAAAFEVIRREFEAELEALDERTLALADPKTALQEAAQARGFGLPEYCKLTVSGPDHHRTWVYAVIWDGEDIAHGEGHSKRSAQVRAARRALVRLGLVPDDPAQP